MIDGLAFIQDKRSRLVGSNSVSGPLLFSGIIEELSFFGKDDQVLLCLKVLLFDLPFGLYFRGKEFWLIVVDIYIY
jgi:hypothetical protein